MSDVRLVGTDPADGSLVPVAVTSAGLLKTQVGTIEEIPNSVTVDGDLTVTGTINGESGGGGGGVELPPDPEEGQVLGWENGELAWLTMGTASFSFFFLIVGAGGGGGYNGIPNCTAGGGGAGGVLNSFGEESSGGNSPTLTPITYSIDQQNLDFTVKVGNGGDIGANGGYSSLTGVDKDGVLFDLQALGGGAGSSAVDINDLDGKTGGSGGGSAWFAGNSQAYSQGVAGVSGSVDVPGTVGQGSGGAGVYGSPRPKSADNCAVHKTEYWCWDAEPGRQNYGGGGGGGAMLPGSGADGGAGLTTLITGSPLTVAGGGAGEPISGSTPAPAPGANYYGGGGNFKRMGQNGVVIIRYPLSVFLDFNEEELTATTTVDGGDAVTIFSAGEGLVRFKETPSLRRLIFKKRFEDRLSEAVSTTDIDLARQK